MTLTRDDILSAEDLKSERVQVPEWGGEVIVRELTGTERDEYESSLVTIKGTKTEVNSRNMRAKLVALSLVDDGGNRLFTHEDIKALGLKSASALDRVVDVAKRISRIAEDDLEEAGKD